MTNEIAAAKPTAATDLRYAWYVAIVLMCFIPGIATGLPNLVMGAPK